MHHIACDNAEYDTIPYKGRKNGDPGKDDHDPSQPELIPVGVYLKS